MRRCCGMQTRFLTFTLFALVALYFTAGARADDLQAMAGTWTVDTAEAGGQQIESEDLKALVVKIVGDHYEVKIKFELSSD